MKFYRWISILFCLVLLQSAWSAELAGSPGSSPQWGSGWIDLAKSTDLAKGERLMLTVGGTAKKIVVRLLPQGAKADLPTGVVGVFDVPASKVVEVPINKAESNIVQISVHGGENPWGQYPLGAGNGAATLIHAERVAGR